MKSLLRTGWIRAGVPKCDIESLADHSWAVSVLTYFFCLEENALREKHNKKTPLNVEKAVLFALFHDFPESEYMDIDKSLYNLSESPKITKFLENIEEGAVNKISKQLNEKFRASFLSVIGIHSSAESRIARVADHIDVLNQAIQYSDKHWISANEFHSFQEYALKELKTHINEFEFLAPFLEREGFLRKNDE